MRWIFFGLIVLHGAIHFMGFAKAFGLAEMPQLTQPITRGMGLTWLAAGLALLVTAVLFLAATRMWWTVGIAAVLLSQTLIFGAWGDARFGTIANVLILAGVVHGFAAWGPVSFRAAYDREVRGRIALPRTALPGQDSSRPAHAPRLAPVIDSDRAAAARTGVRLLTEADLAPLPEPVQRYLRLAGVVGRPRVQHFVASWRGRIRATASDAWMEFTAEQHNFVDEPARFFLMQAERGGLPVDVYHTFEGNAASMRVRLLSLFPLVDQRGADLDRAETVTLFNDLCLLAPAALADPAIRWEPVDSSQIRRVPRDDDHPGIQSVRAYYTAGANTISAELFFNEAGELVDFVSDDRLAASPDGKELVRQRWSTPVREYRRFGPWRVASRGEGRWHAPDGTFVYIELELLDLEIENGSENHVGDHDTLCAAAHGGSDL